MFETWEKEIKKKTQNTVIEKEMTETVKDKLGLHLFLKFSLLFIYHQIKCISNEDR